MISMPIIGNVIMLIASILMVISGLPKDKKTIIRLQTIQIGLMTLGNLLLGSMPGAISNGFNIVRNLLSYYNKLGITQKTGLIIIPAILSLLFNNIGIFVLFPILASGLFTALMTTKNIKMFKLLCIFTSMLWLVHDLYIDAYTSVFFDILTITTNIIGIYRLILVNEQPTN